MKIDQWVTREAVFKSLQENNGKTFDKGSFWFLFLIILVNALVYIGDSINNLGKNK